MTGAPGASVWGIGVYLGLDKFSLHTEYFPLVRNVSHEGPENRRRSAVS